MTQIRYDFVRSGQDAVLQAFEDIDSAATRSAKVAERVASVKVAAEKRVATERMRAERAPVNRTDQLAKQVERDQIRAAQREEREKRRAAQKEERDTDRQSNQLLVANRRTHERQQAQRLRFIREHTRTGERAGKAQAQLDERMRRIRERHELADTRKQERRIATARRSGERSGSALGKHDADRASARGSFGGDVREAFSMPSVMGALGKVGNAIKGIALGAVGTAATLGVGITGAATKDSMQTQEIANRVSINARMAGKGFIDPTELRKEFESVAIANPGQKAADIGGAIQAYITKTGDVASARKYAGTFATVASATGGDVGEIAAAAADISQKFDITNLTDMQDALAALTYQGKEGAFELSDAATKFAKMGSAASAFGFDKGVGGLKTLGGLSQIVQSSTGNADSTGMAVSAMLRQFVGQSGKIKKLTGVDVFTDASKTKTNDIQGLIVDTIAGAKGNLAKIQDIFGDEGGQAMKPMIASFNQAGQALGPQATAEQRVAAGKEAVRAQLSKAINAPGNYADVQKDAAQAQTNISSRLDAAWEKVVAIAGDKLLPVLTDFAERLSENTDLFEAFKAGLEILIGILESLGVIKAKPPEQLAKEASDKSGKADKRADEILTKGGDAGFGGLTKEQQDAFILERATASIEAKQAAELGALGKVRSGTATKEEAASISGMVAMSADDVAKTYLALGNQGGAQDKDKMAEYAKFVGESIYSGNASDLTLDAGRKKVGATGVDETDEQIAFRRQRATTAATDTATGAGPALDEFIAAVKKAAGEIGSTTTGNKPTTVHS